MRRRSPGARSITYWVGPAATDQMSTQGTSTATRAIHQSSSKSVRNANPTNEYAMSLATFAEESARRPRARPQRDRRRGPLRAAEHGYPRASGSASQIGAANAGRTTSADDEDRAGLGQLREIGGDGAEDHERPAQARVRARGRGRARQYGGCSDHQGPSALKASQNAVFAACSSSDASTSGVTSASIVGVNRWSDAARLGVERVGEREPERVQELDARSRP